MKKKSFFSIFMKRFIRTLLFMIILFVVGVASYTITHFYYKITDADKKVKSDSIIKDIVSDIKVEDVSKNLIISVDNNSSKIDNIVLEVFNTKTGNLDYITIPVNTEFTISNKLYQKLYSSNPEVPQIVKLGNLRQYFKEESIGAYGILLLEDLLDVDINYYTVMESSNYEKYFTTTKKSLAELSKINGKSEDIAGTTTIGGNDTQLEVETLSKDVRDELSMFNTKDQYKTFITKFYKNVNSNLTLKNKLKYLDAYQMLVMDHIYYYHLYGAVEESSFIVEVTKSNTLINEILGNDSYDTSQQDMDDSDKNNVISSVGLKIQILNGSKITGLAGKYKEKLMLSGYTVASVNNYEDAVLTQTRIIVAKENTGLDLIENFNNPELEVGGLPDGIDIQIILGTNDNILQ